MSDEAVPCPGCSNGQRMVLPGAICFDCQRTAHAETENDIGRIERFLRPHLAFADWRIEHGDLDP